MLGPPENRLGWQHSTDRCHSGLCLQYVPTVQSQPAGYTVRCPALLQTWFHVCFHCRLSFPFWQNFLFSCNYGEGLREEGLSLKTTLSGEHWKQKAAEHSLRACSSSTSSPQDLWVFFLIQHLLETGPVRGSGDTVLRSKENEATAYPETHLGGCWVTLILTSLTLPTFLLL